MGDFLLFGFFHAIGKRKTIATASIAEAEMDGCDDV